MLKKIKQYIRTLFIGKTRYYQSLNGVKTYEEENYERGREFYINYTQIDKIDSNQSSDCSSKP